MFFSLLFPSTVVDTRCEPPVHLNCMCSTSSWIYKCCCLWDVNLRIAVQILRRVGCPKYVLLKKSDACTVSCGVCAMLRTLYDVVPVANTFHNFDKLKISYDRLFLMRI
jgi:hypothetical protein